MTPQHKNQEELKAEGVTTPEAVEAPQSDPDSSSEGMSLRGQLMRQWPGWDWERRSE